MSSIPTYDHRPMEINIDPDPAHLARLIATLIRPYYKWMLIIFGAMMIEAIVGLSYPWPLKIIIDHVINGKSLPPRMDWFNAMFALRNVMNLAFFCGLILVIIAGIDGLFRFIDNYFTEKVAQYIANDLRLRIYHHLQRLSMTYYDTHRVGKLLSTITDDVTMLQDFISVTLVSIIIDSITILGMFGLMMYLKWDFALIAVGVAPFLLLFVFRLKKVVKIASHELRQDQAEMITTIQQGLQSIKTVHLFGRQELEEDRLKKVSLETVHVALKAKKVKSIITPVFSIAVSICTAFVLWRGAGLVLSGLMTIGSLTVFLAYMSKFFEPVKDLAKMTVNITQAIVALERIQQILSVDVIIPQKPDAVNPSAVKGDIVFEHVCFSYKPGINILKDINLHIQAGERIGICGPTGGGKSTVASLIPRLYLPTSGRVLLDGRDVADYIISGLRDQIGFVLQDTMLFYGTIRENIAYGRPGASDLEILQAARLANIEDFVQKLPEGLDTPVGERGITLSGGEKQRIGIARAILKNAPILILDEPTTSLDAESEKKVVKALENLMKGKTVITISHKLNTIVSADRIYVIKDGMIVEHGSHEELLRLNRIYADLYQSFQNKSEAIPDKVNTQTPGFLSLPDG